MPKGRVLPNNGLTWFDTRGVAMGDGAMGGAGDAAVTGWVITGVHVAPSIFNMFTAGWCRVNCLG